eukprot:CAMPEP_0197388244 /NCGR_PEP_ID=MMETSP1165-20131217/968_1 /TAXON_ID=284809 /ORGANISM="Chrysocystis fragilis, Strain CCMP3189" /LENGTH=41 /DNA_ID= /DNA_START= /DNA_END= /DNA_ORIENTATION=
MTAACAQDAPEPAQGECVLEAGRELGAPHHLASDCDERRRK